MTVSLSLATEAASVPIAWRLYLPQQWCDGATRRKAADQVVVADAGRRLGQPPWMLPLLPTQELVIYDAVVE